jgi:hypothetical protein
MAVSSAVRERFKLGFLSHEASSGGRSPWAFVKVSIPSKKLPKALSKTSKSYSDRQHMARLRK